MERLITLAQEGLEVGIAAHLGGRICHFRRPGGRNCLLFDDADLGRRPQRDFSPRARFVPLNGHIVWLGPQDHWWTQQRINPSRRRRAAPWPPDPWLVRGAYEVVRREAHAVELLSPVSPQSGVRLRKRIALAGDGRLHFAVEAENCSRCRVSWGLWCNTRVPAYGRCWVPLRDEDAVRMQAGEPTVPHVVEDGLFSFTPKRPRAGAPAASAKAFIDPARAAILADTPGGLLLIEARRSLPEAIAPGQACIEIYNGCAHDDAASLLELEWHAPYETLAPGERMGAEQRWRLLPVDTTQAAARAML